MDDAGVLYRGARVIDCTGAPPTERSDVLVRDGRIQMIGASLAANGAATRKTPVTRPSAILARNP